MSNFFAKYLKFRAMAYGTFGIEIEILTELTVTALLYLRRRRLILRHLEKLVRNVDKAQSDPEYKLAPSTESVNISHILTNL